eukprot:scaffold2.g6843.t1
MNAAPRAAPGGTSKAGQADAPRPLDTGAVTKRLQQELMSMMASGADGVSAFPSGDSLFDWVGTINGAEGTVYEGLTFRLSLKFTSEYPFKPPAVRFESGCFHPNVDANGYICLDILKDKWSAAYSVKSVLQSIQSLLADPNVDSPLNAHAAKLWGVNMPEYKALVAKTYAASKAAAASASS